MQSTPPSRADAPGVASVTPGVPETPESPASPASPDVPQVRATPVASDVPGVRATPVTSDVPEMRATPVTSDAPDVRPTPVTSGSTPPVPVASSTAPIATSSTSAATPTADAIVSLAGVSRDYGDGVGVFDIDLVVPRGTILGIVGPSGAGKTTTIRLITGALDPSSGEVRALGEDPRHFLRGTRERIGYMPQQFALYPDLTADENVDFVASLFGLLFRRRRRRVREVLQLVGLWDARGRRAGKLSGGMQRRLELACALVHEPDLLLLDEPTAGIDPILRKVIWEELTRLRDAGRTLLVTTQYVTEAEQCDAVALIAGGRLVALGTPTDLRRRASGGDIIEIETAAAFDPEPLAGQHGILAVRSTGSRTFQVVADDVGTTTPMLDDLVSAAGGRLVSAREVHPTFDEVFTTLVERDRKARDAMVAQEGGGDDHPGASGTDDPRSAGHDDNDVAGAA
jgi:ABC-2 type transport system ATP-binding protein